MVDDLLSIKSFILEQLTPEYRNNLPVGEATVQLGKLDRYLDRLREDLTDQMEQKACRQLLCSIGIDLKHGTVTPAHYYEIFTHVDFDSPSAKIRKPFFDAIFNQDLVFYADQKETSEYCVMVFPAKDYSYYVDPSVLGISGTRQVEYRINLIKEKIAQNIPIIKIIELHKKWPLSYFWVSTRDCFDEILDKDSDNPVLEIVNRLGLSHFKFDDLESKFFFCIDFGEMPIKTFKPNATMINWLAPNTGFISYHDKEEGKTFCISGYTDYPNGLIERTFNGHLVPADTLKEMKIKFLEKRIETPFTISPDVVNEGITRFNA
jgi:hypothetical protein